MRLTKISDARRLLKLISRFSLSLMGGITCSAEETQAEKFQDLERLCDLPKSKPFIASAAISDDIDANSLMKIISEMGNLSKTDTAIIKDLTSRSSRRDINNTIPVSCSLRVSSSLSSNLLRNNTVTPPTLVTEKGNNSPRKRIESKDDSQWEIVGNFIKLRDYGPEVPLNRSFKVKSLIQESQIKEIEVLGYNDGNIRISVEMREVDPELELSLKEKRLMKSRLPFYPVIYSIDKNRLSEYLNVFFSYGLLPQLTMEKILWKIENEKPGEAALRSYFYNFEAAHQRAKEISCKINRINAIGQIQNLGSFTPAIAKNVLQRHVGYTQAEERYHIIGSFGAGPCLIMAAYNPKHKTAALCHIDSMTNLTSLHSIFFNLSATKDKNSIVEVHLAGGDESSKEMVGKVINIIENFDVAKIKSANLLCLNPAQLAIDSRTGEVFTNFSAYQLDLGKDISLRLKIVSLILDKQSLTIEPGLRFKG